MGYVIGLPFVEISSNVGLCGAPARKQLLGAAGRLRRTQPQK